MAFCHMEAKLGPFAIRVKDGRCVGCQACQGTAVSRVGSGSNVSARILLSHFPCAQGQGLCLSMPLLLMPCPHLIGFPHNWDEIIHGSAQETATTIVILLRFNLTEGHLGALWRIKQNFFSIQGLQGEAGKKRENKLRIFP